MPQRINEAHLAEDRALVQEFRAQQPPSPQRDRAFGQLLTGHQRMVFTYCLRMVGDLGIAEDITQLVFLALWKNGLDRLENPDGLHRWLRTVAVRECGAQLPSPPRNTAREEVAGLDGAGTGGASARRSHHRLRLSEIPSSDTAAMFDRPAEGGGEDLDNALLNVHVEELYTLLDELVTVLPPKLQQTYVLHVREGWDGIGLARRLGVADVEGRRLKHELLKKELPGLLVANLVARAAVSGGEEAGCNTLVALLRRAGWSTGPLPRRLATKVMNHISGCADCGGRAEKFWRQWRPWMLPLMVDSDLRRSILDRVESTAATADAPDTADAHQPGSGTGPDSVFTRSAVRAADASRTRTQPASELAPVGPRPSPRRHPGRPRRRIAAAAVLVLCVIAGGRAWQVSGQPMLTIATDPPSPSVPTSSRGNGDQDDHGDLAPGTFHPSAPPRPDREDTRSRATASAGTGRTGDGSDSGTSAGSTRGSKESQGRGSGKAATTNGTGSTDGSADGTPEDDSAGSGDGAPEDDSAGSGDGALSGSTDGSADGTPEDDSAGSGDIAGPPPPPASRTLVVHLSAPSDGGIAVTSNGVGLGSCSKAYAEAAKDCVYTVHDGDTVRLTPQDFVYSWGGAPCAGVGTHDACSFSATADTGFNLYVQREAG
ncbi:sigma factor [Streptomyces sp. NPDC005263]|uniref:RNA polymerase sigma factor n=1 Tax=Streptomyces sp. NPDC005263 TaxID=3364711 RepID=UPI0036855D5D